MANPTGESNGEALRLDFDRRLMFQFRGSVVTSAAGLLPYRELDDALGLVRNAKLAQIFDQVGGHPAKVGIHCQRTSIRLIEI